MTLAPNLSEAHVAMGYYYYRCKLAYELAIKEFDEAIRLQPNNAEALAGVGYVFLRLQGKMREALGKIRKSFELNPRNGNLAMQVADGAAVQFRWTPSP